MGNRKKYIIDKNFQLRATFTIIGITSFIIAIIIAGIGFNIANNNKKLANITLIQENVFDSLFTFSQVNQKREQKIAVNNVAKEHYKNIETIKNIININNIFLAAIIIVAVLQFIALYIIMIRKTHKVSGPIHVMTMYINDILRGIFPKLRSLRKGDELKEFHDLFIKLINYIDAKGIFKDPD